MVRMNTGRNGTGTGVVVPVVPVGVLREYHGWLLTIMMSYIHGLRERWRIGALDKGEPGICISGLPLNTYDTTNEPIVARCYTRRCWLLLLSIYTLYRVGTAPLFSRVVGS